MQSFCFGTYLFYRDNQNEKTTRMQARHTNRKQYFDELAYTSEHYFMPYISQYKSVERGSRVLEVGCGDGGNLIPFAKHGCEVTGVDIAQCRINDAQRFFDEQKLSATFIGSDVFLLTELHHRFDIIICHDVIEHISEKALFINRMKEFLAPGGVIFISFPAWQMPFGGHQQICRSKVLSHIPYYHLLPVSLYKWCLKAGHESDDCIRELISIKATKCPIELFEHAVANAVTLIVKNRTLFFINPHYQVKFGLHPRRLSAVLCHIPYLRNYLTSSCFYILSNSH